MDKCYLELLEKVLKEGEKRETRNSVTYSLFGERLCFDLQEGFPLLTSKKMFFRGIKEELLFFLRGETDTKKLEAKGVGIWRGNTSKEFIDSLGLELKEGDMGPMYGYQWRNFNSQGIDQLQAVIDELRANPTSRRLIFTAFNPAQASQGVLYPCHGIVVQLYVRNGTYLDLQMYQRSGDIFLGVPFNIASYAILQSIIARIAGYSPGRLTLVFGDVHLYSEHLEAARTQLARPTHPPPTLSLSFSPATPIDQIEASEIAIEGYTSEERISAPMIA